MAVAVLRQQIVRATVVAVVAAMLLERVVRVAMSYRHHMDTMAAQELHTQEEQAETMGLFLVALEDHLGVLVALEGASIRIISIRLSRAEQAEPQANTP